MYRLILIKLYTLFAVTQLPSRCSPQPRFEVEFQWQVVNFSWPSPVAYQKAIDEETYIPENVAFSGIKYYKDRLYMSIPKRHDGVPATLGYVSLDLDSPRFNQPITPYPSWDMNTRKDCLGIKSVQSMEIDRNGIMWVLDGMRLGNNTECPAKLVLLDLNDNGKIVYSFTFPDNICLQKGGFLNDIVLDEAATGFAYITDASLFDPGLIMFSRKQSKALKFRDHTMFAENSASGFVVDKVAYNELSPIDGIALSPPSSKGRKVFFSPLVSYNLYLIETIVLQNESLYNSGDWRRHVKLVGKKQDVGDGMIVDNKGNLYYTLLSSSSVGKWNIDTPFSSAKTLDKNKTMVWPDSFTFDDKGNLRLLTDNFQRFASPTYKLKVTSEVKFRVFKLHTGTNSYNYGN